MATKIVVVTGSNAGLGYHCVQSLANSASVNTIVMACRNTTEANKAANAIAAASSIGFKRDNIVVLPEACDLSDLKSVRTYSESLLKWLAGRKITALINNAGIGGSPVHSKNAVGHEKTFATNHLGHFLLSLLMLPSISERIVNVSSEVHDPKTGTGAPDPEIGYPSSREEYNTRMLAGERINGENDLVSGQRRYSRSKLCNIFFTNELAFRLSGDVPKNLDESTIAATLLLPHRSSCTLSSAKRIRCVAYNPGLMLDSKFVTSSMGSILGWVVYLLSPVIRLTSLGSLMRSTPVSGERLCRLALGEIASDGSAEAVTAAYYSDESRIPSSTFSLTKVAATKFQAELWDCSVEWAGVTEKDLIATGFKGVNK